MTILEQLGTQSLHKRVLLGVVMLMGQGSMGLSASVIPPLLVPLAEDLGGGAAGTRLSQIALVLPFLGLTLGGLGAGFLIERTGLRAGIILSALLFAASGLVCATVDVSFLPRFFCACFLIGAASSGLATGGDLLVATYLSGTARAKMLGFQSAFGGMLASGAAYVSGHIADAHGWHASFGQFVAAGTLTCAAAVYVVSVTGSETVHAPHLLDRVTLLFPLAPLYAAIFFSTMVAMTTAAHVPLLMAEAGATSVSATSIVIAMQGAFCMVAALSYGFIQARIGERWTLCAAIVIGCGGFLLTGLSGAAVSYGMGAAMIGAAVGLSQPYFLGSVIRSAPMAVRPQACGLFGTATFLGAFANPFIMAPVRNVLGLHGLYIATSFACAVIGFGALRMTGRAKLVENTYV